MDIFLSSISFSSINIEFLDTIRTISGIDYLPFVIRGKDIYVVDLILDNFAEKMFELTPDILKAEYGYDSNKVILIKGLMGDINTDFYEFLTMGWKKQGIFLGISLLTFGATLIPFVLWKGSTLFFFEYNPFILQTRQGSGIALLIFIMLAV